MRELKFRAWDSVNKKWLHWGDIEKKLMINPVITGRTGQFYIHQSDTSLPFDEVEVTQYTGKKVKTGEVFEGDIGKSIDGIFLVVWDEEKCAFMMQFYDYPNERLYLEEIQDDSEIIGNIYENPELLEGCEC